MTGTVPAAAEDGIGARARHAASDAAAYPGRGDAVVTAGASDVCHGDLAIVCAARGARAWLWMGILGGLWRPAPALWRCAPEVARGKAGLDASSAPEVTKPADAIARLRLKD